MAVLLATQACNTDPAPCPPGDDGRSCRADAVTAALPDHPDQAAALANALDDPHDRDLALLLVARQTGRDLCGEIQDRILRATCSETVNRLHLYEKQPGPTAIAKPGPDDLPGCASGPKALRDDCHRALAADALAADNRDDAAAACERITAPALQGECAASVASAAAGGGAHAEGAEICAALPAGQGRDECHFRLSEALAPDALAARGADCKLAGRYADECWRHAIRALAEHGAALHPRDLDSARVDAERVAQTVQNESLPAAVARELYWMERAHAANWRALTQGDFATQAAWVNGLNAAAAEEATDPTVAVLFSDSLQMVALRAALRGSTTVPDLADLLTSPERTPPPRGPPPSPRYAVIGRVPPPLSSLSGCALSAPDRAATIALWALGPVPLSRSGTALAQALRHPTAAVRAVALQAADEKANSWLELSAEQREWLAGHVQGRASDPHPAIAARASRLAASLRTNEALAGWRMIDELCDTAKAAGSPQQGYSHTTARPPGAPPE